MLRLGFAESWLAAARAAAGILDDAILAERRGEVISGEVREIKMIGPQMDNSFASINDVGRGELNRSAGSRP